MCQTGRSLLRGKCMASSSQTRSVQRRKKSEDTEGGEPKEEGFFDTVRRKFNEKTIRPTPTPPLEDIVPSLILARNQLKIVQERTRTDPQTAREALREGAFGDLRPAIKAIAEYAQKEKLVKQTKLITDPFFDALSELDYGLGEASRTMDDKRKEAEKKKPKKSKKKKKEGEAEEPEPEEPVIEIELSKDLLKKFDDLKDQFKRVVAVVPAQEMQKAESQLERVYQESLDESLRPEITEKGGNEEIKALSKLFEKESNVPRVVKGTYLGI